MGFEVIRPAWARPPVDADAITLSSRDGARGDAYIIFTFGPAILAKLGWQVGDRIEVAFGSETDLGKVRLQKTERPHSFKLSGRRHVTLSVGSRSLPAGFSVARWKHLKLQYQDLAAKGGAASLVFLYLPRDVYAAAPKPKRVA